MKESSQYLEIDELQVPSTCLKENRFTVPENNLKRKPQEEAPFRYRKKEDTKRVSFGGRTEFILSPVPSLTHEPNDPSEILETSDQLFKEISTISADMEHKLDFNFQSFKENYNQAINYVQKSIGISPCAPTEQDVEDLTLENEQLQAKIEALENQLKNSGNETEEVIQNEETAEKELKESLKEVQSAYELQQKNLNNYSNKLQCELEVFSDLLGVTLTKEPQKYLCQGKKKPLKFNFEESGKFYKYQPIDMEVPYPMLKHQIDDVSKPELRMVFSRILKALADTH